MLGFAWLPLRQAEEALKNGRLEEAQRLLTHPEARDHKGSWDLLQQVAKGYADRGDRKLQHDDFLGGWNDLTQAEKLGGSDQAIAKLRQKLTQRGLAESKMLLDAGEPSRALDMLEQLRGHGILQSEVQILEQAAKTWGQAQDLATKGEFAQALALVERIRRNLSSNALAGFQRDLEQRAREFAPIVADLHDATSNKEWRRVLELSEKSLALAPHHAESRKARTAAWKSVEPPTMPVPRAEREAKSAPPLSQKYALWIDGVGGFLLCMGSRVSLGQMTPESSVDIPLFADVSRVHATIQRDSEGYLLEAVRTVKVNGLATEKALLQTNDRITLGASCQLQITQPVPISATSRIKVVSGHRLPLGIDEVFMMADTLVLGPTTQCHIVIPDLPHQVVLYRHRDGLGVRHAGPFLIDGEPQRDRGILKQKSRVQGDDFALALEPITSWQGK